MSEDPRAPLLRRVLAFETPIEPIREALRELPYDCDEDLVLLTPGDIIGVIDRCVAGELSVEAVVDWAEFLEIREGVGCAPPHGARLREILFRLANPYLYGDVTTAVLTGLRTELARLRG